MTAQEINENALNCLRSQRWKEAQEKFFENAKKNPSHETYNNLGYFLINEGIECKNGRVRNAQKLGVKYLSRAAEIRESQINLCAIAKAYEYELISSSEKKREELFQQTSQCLKKALAINYSPVIDYNYIRSLYLMNPRDNSLLEKTKKLLTNYVSNESVSLYLELLCNHLLLDEGIRYIEQYKKYLNEIDMLMFFSRFELYDKAYPLCKAVCEQFSLDKYIASAIIESCMNTCHFEQARIYAKQIKDLEDDFHYNGKEVWTKEVFDNMESSDELRKNLISHYSMLPPFVDSCCYFGCSVHGTEW